MKVQILMVMASLLSFGFSAVAQAGHMGGRARPGIVVCQGETGFGKATVTIDRHNRRVVVEGEQMKEPQVFENLSEQYGMLTGPGIAVHYRNEFGCLRNAHIMTAFRDSDPRDWGYVQTLRVSVCSGGHLRDELCGVAQGRE